MKLSVYETCPILVAWRISDVQVVCVDRERREVFGHYVDVFSEVETLENVQFAESDIADTGVTEDSYVVCIHACNEAMQLALDKTQAHEGIEGPLTLTFRWFSIAKIDSRTLVPKFLYQGLKAIPAGIKHVINRERAGGADISMSNAK